MWTVYNFTDDFETATFDNARDADAFAYETNAECVCPDGTSYGYTDGLRVDHSSTIATDTPFARVTIAKE